MSITSKPFGKTNQGETITAYTMTNAKGASVTILDFGGTITQIRVPDRNGDLDSVTLGSDDVRFYLRNATYMGTLVGRVGNRIGGASFELGGKTYPLAKNDGVNTLHGGVDGFSWQMWKATPIEGDGKDTLRLELLSPDGQEGFPGTLKVTVEYRWCDGCALSIHYAATTDKTTLCNLTNHAYFNLDGQAAGSVEDLELQVFADKLNEVGAGLIPTGKLLDSKELLYGFTKPTRLGDVLKHTDEDAAMKPAGGVDFNYCMGREREMKHAATLYSPKTGRVMKVETDLPGVQVYTGQGLNETGFGGVHYGRFAGICLETQCYPDAIHHPYFPSIVLRPEDRYDTETIYRFSVR